MGRHVRPAASRRVWGGVERWLLAWAARTGAWWNSRRPGRGTSATLAPGRRILREAGLAVGLAAAAAGVYGLMFVLAGHHRSPGPAQQPLQPQSARPAGRLPSAALQPDRLAGATAIAAAAPTPPPGPMGGGPTVHAVAAPVSTGDRSQATASPAAPVAATPASAEAASGNPVGPVEPPAPAAPSALGPTQPPPTLQPPVPGPVLAGFGWAYSQVFGDWQEHTGVDLGATVGAAVAAPGPGVVLAVRQDHLWGWVVSIALDHGYSTNVSALGTVVVRAGEAVRTGQEIGTVAASPPAEGLLPPHVLWQVFAGARPLNPAGG